MKSFHAFLVILAMAIVITSIATDRSNRELTTPTPAAQTTEVLSETDEDRSTPIPTSSTPPIQNPSPHPSATPDTITQNSPMLIFPGAKIVSQDNSQTVLESTANPNEIANWYRAKFNELGMRAIASSQNNTNGNFQAKMQAAEGNRKYDIEITRASGENSATIILR